ncbi:VWA domain-containing protein [filamentous cyanobacterium LEGE 11480]|uniref:VWA domain-containing protein n=1 Tax=Romeriopsis navalis LEGE 11480 TaxID=2777977 RepID=A0A928VTT0_9CYAN|nr:VWA domain-containing protein [Romeriopsis navalis]MBE9032921.1 VWA domain-containing protein [Romeriopsis navalis LEGE 11480]
MKVGLEFNLSDVHVDAQQENSQRQVAISVFALPENTSNSAARAVPLNICLVLDHSGSMRGEAMDTVKQAAKELIQRLQPGDRIAIVGFDHEATVIVPNQTIDNLDWIEQQLSQLTAAGGTNIDAGIKAGIEELAKGKKDTISQLLLLTDGENEHGSNDRCLKLAELATSYTMTINSLGFGDRWNQDVLEQIADAGGGALSHIATPNQASTEFEKLFNRVETIMLTNAHISLRMVNGTTLAALKPVAQVSPETIELPVITEGETAMVRLGDIMVDTPRVILANLYLPQLAAGKHPITEIQVCYDNPATGEMGLLSEVSTLETEVQTTYEPAPNPEVQTRILALAKYRQTQIAEKKIAAGDHQGAVTMLQTAANTALQMGDQNAATVLQGSATQLQSGAALSEEMKKRTRMAAKTMIQPSEPTS